MSSMFLAITSVSAGVAAWLAGASAALSSAAAATQPMPILVMICLPPISLLAPRPAAARDAAEQGGSAGCSGRRQGMAAIIARDRPHAQQKAARQGWAPFGFGIQIRAAPELPPDPGEVRCSLLKGLPDRSDTRRCDMGS